MPRARECEDLLAFLEGITPIEVHTTPELGNVFQKKSFLRIGVVLLANKPPQQPYLDSQRLRKKRIQNSRRLSSPRLAKLDRNSLRSRELDFSGPILIPFSPQENPERSDASDYLVTLIF